MYFRRPNKKIDKYLFYNLIEMKDKISALKQWNSGIPSFLN